MTESDSIIYSLPKAIQKITYPNGEIYEGETREGKREGYGKMTDFLVYMKEIGEMTKEKE
jgi:hypothetical protein